MHVSLLTDTAKTISLDWPEIFRLGGAGRVLALFFAPVRWLGGWDFETQWSVSGVPL